MDPIPLHHPDLAPSGFHLFGVLKDVLRDPKFSDTEELKISLARGSEGSPQSFLKVLSKSGCKGRANV